jgi:ribosome maturation factor RimP
MTAPDHADLREVVAPPVGEVGLVVDDLRFAPGRPARLTVTVDLPADAVGGVEADLVASVSRDIAAALDAADAVPGAYTLEVTTPGATRPLTAERHWRRARTRLVEAALAGGERLTLRVAHTDDDGVDFADERGDIVRHVPYGELSRGDVVLEFSRPGPKE